MSASSSVTESLQHIIRVATPVDAQALAQLRYALRASTGRATEPEAEFLERCTAWMHKHLESDAWKCWVAEVDQQLIGAIWVQLVEKIPNPRAESEHHGYITNFYIEPQARGGGLGSQMLHVALDWCRTRDVHAVILWPTERSRTLYERHGFAVREDVMELIIKQPK